MPCALGSPVVSSFYAAVNLDVYQQTKGLEALLLLQQISFLYTIHKLVMVAPCLINNDDITV